MTFICLDVTDLVHVRDPNVNARVRADDPSEYSQRLAEVIISTGSTPSLIGDKMTIQAIMKTGVKENHANDYAQVGCLEPNAARRTFGHTGAILINLISALGLVLNNGHSKRAKNVGLKTGELSEFKDFSQFMEALKEQLRYIIQNATRLNNICGEIHKYSHPQPLLSALIEGPMESGKSLLDGGATYNSSGVAFIALSDLIDSLYVIKKLVYDEKKFTLTELNEIVDNNFENDDYAYNFIINKLDHFGNGKEEVDRIGVEIVDFLYDECRNTENYRGGYYNPGYWSISIHGGFGKLTGAYPHGKLKGEPLTSGLTPFSKTQKNGPTGVLNSLASLPTAKMPNGMALNLKFNKSLFQSQEKIDLFNSLISAYFDNGGMQVQFTIHDAKELIEAKKNPDKYPDLMVRISGYTAYFRDLDDHMKDEIINRAIMNL
jgi:formate C-acetyltransferase